MGELAPGTVLGGCRIDAVVGRGGMGVVYRARQLELDRDVAVKVIAPELVEDPQIRSRFLSEARAASAVEHPNVVPVHGAGIADGRAYLVMRYVEGHDLRTVVLAEGPLSTDRATRIAQQLGEALDAIHHLGYVHRDLKPQNVMVGAAGHVYLSDFGLAKQPLATAGDTRSEQWVGTLDYVAPEQIRGERVDARADVYSFGGVLYFMLTKRVPFERASDHAKLWAHLADPPPRPSDARPELPPELDAVVLRAMAKDPAERYPSAGDLVRSARSAAGHADAPAPERTVARGAAAPERPTIPSHSRVAARRRPRLPVLAAGALIVVAGTAALLLLGGDDGGDPRVRASATSRPPPVFATETTRAVGRRPRDAVVANGRVWVLSAGEPEISGLDIDSLRPTAPQPAVEPGAAAMARDGDALWIANPRRKAVIRVSTETGNVTRHLPMPEPPIRIAVGRSGLWVVGREDRGGSATLYRFDRDGNSQQAPIEFEEGVNSIVLGGGYLWVALEKLRSVKRVAPGAAAAEHGAWLSDAASDLAYSGRYLWASVPGDDSVARIDLRSGDVQVDPVGRHPGQLAVAGNRLFVATFLDDRVVVVNPRTRVPVARVRVPSNPYGVTAGSGYIWVTGMGHNTLTRLDPGP